MLLTESRGSREGAQTLCITTFPLEVPKTMSQSGWPRRFNEQYLRGLSKLV